MTTKLREGFIAFCRRKNADIISWIILFTVAVICLISFEHIPNLPPVRGSIIFILFAVTLSIDAIHNCDDEILLKNKKHLIYVVLSDYDAFFLLLMVLFTFLGMIILAIIDGRIDIINVIIIVILNWIICAIISHIISNHFYKKLLK